MNTTTTATENEDVRIIFTQFWTVLLTRKDDLRILGRIRPRFRRLRNIDINELVNAGLIQLAETHGGFRFAYAQWMLLAKMSVRREGERIAAEIAREGKREVPIDDPDSGGMAFLGHTHTPEQALLDAECLQSLELKARQIVDRVIEIKNKYALLRDEIMLAILRYWDELNISLPRHLADTTGLDRRRCSELSALIQGHL